MVSQHFGRCPSFTIVEVVNKRLEKQEVVQNPGHHPGYLPQFFSSLNVRGIVCGGMGQRASDLFRDLGIDIFTGIEGRVAEVIERLVRGELKPGQSFCTPGSGKNYGIEKTVCDHKE